MDTKTGYLQVHIDDETQRVTVTALIGYDDFWRVSKHSADGSLLMHVHTFKHQHVEFRFEGTEISGKIVPAWYHKWEMTLQEIYDYLGDPMRENRVYLDIGYTYNNKGVRTKTLAMDLHNGYCYTLFTREKSIQILEALLKHDGEYDIEIRIVDKKGEYPFPPIECAGKPLNLQLVQEILSLIKTS